jgi:hypothetical protein
MIFFLTSHDYNITVYKSKLIVLLIKNVLEYDELLK